MLEKEYVEALRFGDDGAFGRQAVYIRQGESSESNMEDNAKL